MNTIAKIIRVIVISMIVSGLIGGGNAYAEEKSQTAFARVNRIVSSERMDPDEIGFGYDMIKQVLELEIISGEYKGTVIQSEHILDENYAYNIYVDEGDEVLVFLEKSDDGRLLNAFVTERARQKYLIWLTIAFFACLVLLAGRKGLASVIALTLTGLGVFRFLLPNILKGYNPIMLSLIVCGAVIVVTLILINGFTRKTYSAIVGTSGGVIVAGILAYGVGQVAQLTGLGNQEAQMLMFIPQGIQFNFQGILFAAIIIGALGAIMDVGMSIASAMHEVETAKPDIETKKLIQAGINVGKDMMGTMSNTLILAYTGGALHLLLLFMAYEIPVVEIVNMDMIASEVVRAMAGSIGLVFTVPITAVVSGTIGRRYIR
jgi:uncharacterized membrane protein